MTATVAVLVGYLATLAALAIWSRRETHSLKGFYLAGKKLPYWVVAFSTNATGESGWLLLGLTGMGYAVGAQAYWVIVGEMIGIGLSWGLISRRLKRLSDETDSITVPDVLAANFDDRRNLIRGIAVTIIIVMVTTYVSAQIVATGKAFSGFIDLDYRAGVLIGAVIIIAYTFVGGYKAVSYTDVVQGVLMLAGLIAVPVVAINAGGGWDSLSTTLDAYDPDFTDMFAVLDGSTAGLVAAVSFAAIGLPFLGVPQLLIRYMSARDEEELRKARIVSIVVLFIFLFGAVTAGIAGRALFPDLADSEQVREEGDGKDTRECPPERGETFYERPVCPTGATRNLILSGTIDRHMVRMRGYTHESVDYCHDDEEAGYLFRRDQVEPLRSFRKSSADACYATALSKCERDQQE